MHTIKPTSLLYKTVELKTAMQKPREHYTKLALDLQGTAWNISALMGVNNLRKSFNKAFTFAVTSLINRFRDVCQRCTCKNIANFDQLNCSGGANITHWECFAKEGRVSRYFSLSSFSRKDVGLNKTTSK